MSADTTDAAVLALVDAGTPAAILEPILEMRGVRAAARRWACGPVVVHGRGWEDSLPEWMKKRAVRERFEIVLDELADGEGAERVGPSELTCVMQGAVLSAPLDRDLTDLFLWATVSAVSAEFERDPEEVWAMVGAEPILDAAVYEPSGRLYRPYTGLAADIRRKVAQAAVD